MSEPKDLSEIRKAMDTINNAQETIWMLHHHVKNHDEELGMAIWKETLRIEHALLVLNEKVLGGEGYLE